MEKRKQKTIEEIQKQAEKELLEKEEDEILRELNYNLDDYRIKSDIQDEEFVETNKNKVYLFNIPNDEYDNKKLIKHGDVLFTAKYIGKENVLDMDNYHFQLLKRRTGDVVEDDEEIDINKYIKNLINSSLESNYNNAIVSEHDLMGHPTLETAQDALKTIQRKIKRVNNLENNRQITEIFVPYVAAYFYIYRLDEYNEFLQKFSNEVNKRMASKAKSGLTSILQTKNMENRHRINFPDITDQISAFQYRYKRGGGKGKTHRKNTKHKKRKHLKKHTRKSKK